MPSNDTPKTVVLRGDPVSKEGTANAAGILPGHLLERMSTGNIRVHSTAGGMRPALLFARVEEYTGGGLDTAYASGDRIPMWSCRPGDEVYALVPAGAAAIAIGDMLESAGDGTLRKIANYLTDSSGGTANTTVQSVSGAYTQAEVANNFADVAAAINAYKTAVSGVARALQAVDNSGGGSAVRIKVEIV